GKVASFGSWNAFESILNEKRSGFPVIAGLEPCCGVANDHSPELKWINDLRADGYYHDPRSTPDIITQLTAMYYLKSSYPRVMSLSYNETDEWAHASRYMDYLEAAHSVDKWISDIWNYVQSSPQYKDKTALFITVDHGRGYKDKWTAHGNT